MHQRIGRNASCPCGSGKKYKKCCLESTQPDSTQSATWIDEGGIHIVGKGVRPTKEEREEMTKEYQKRVKKSPLWEMLVQAHGKDKAEEILQDFRVESR